MDGIMLLLDIITKLEIDDQQMIRYESRATTKVLLENQDHWIGRLIKIRKEQ